MLKILFKKKSVIFIDNPGNRDYNTKHKQMFVLKIMRGEVSDGEK